MQVSQLVRRSKRLNSETPSVDPSEADTASTAALIPESKKSRKLRHVIENPYKDEWLVDIGAKLFDIVSVPRKPAYEEAIDEGTEPKEVFDVEFYKDQQGNRTQYIETRQLTKEFKQKEFYLYVHQCRASRSNGKQCHRGTS